MPKSSQVIHTIEVAQLKNLTGLSSLALDASPLTGITGANGAGKSTILHALACSFRPLAGIDRTDYKFPDFFLPTSDSRWQGSSFEICHSYRDGAVLHDRQIQQYGKAEDRWTPRYAQRPERHLVYVGVRSCVPKIEEERATTFLELQTERQADDVARQVREAASRVMNRQYAETSKKSHWTGKFYRGVVCNGLGYSSLSMGAGEQRVFEILDALYSSPRNSLILVDEIDLLLHEDALGKLIDELHARASDKSIQVVFTTHRESILARGDKVCVHHIFSSPGKTLSLPGTHPDVWHRLTGRSVRPVEVFVEDDLSAAIVAREADGLRMRRHVEITSVGAAANVLTLACGYALRDALSDNQVFVTDGDVLRSAGERRAQIARVLTGDTPRAIAQRSSVSDRAMQFVLPETHWPEKFIHGLLVGLTEEQIGNDSEIVDAAREIGEPAERHGFVDGIVSRLGHARDVGLLKVVEVASRSEHWATLAVEVREWLANRKLALGL